MLERSQFIKFLNKGFKFSGNGYEFVPVNNNGQVEQILNCTLTLFLDQAEGDSARITKQRAEWIPTLIKNLKSYWNTKFIYSGINGANYPDTQIKIYLTSSPNSILTPDQIDDSINPSGGTYGVKIEEVPSSFKNDAQYNADHLQFTLEDKQLFIYCTERNNTQAVADRDFAFKQRLVFLRFDSPNPYTVNPMFKPEDVGNAQNAEGIEYTVPHEFGHVFGLTDRYHYVQFYFQSYNKLYRQYSNSVAMWLPSTIDSLYFQDISGNLMSTYNISILGSFHTQRRPMLTPMQMGIVLDPRKTESPYPQYTFISGQEGITDDSMLHTNLRYIGIDEKTKNIVMNIPVDPEKGAGTDFKLNNSSNNEKDFGASLKNSTFAKEEAKIGLYLSTIPNPNNAANKSDAEVYYDLAIQKAIKRATLHGYFNPTKNPDLDTIGESGKIKQKIVEQNLTNSSRGIGSEWIRTNAWNSKVEEDVKANRTRLLNMYLELRLDDSYDNPPQPDKK
jgi:hypothetical protein